ncbi:MAG: DUF2190 family protein [Candidatus Bathyarchaeota archaeon]|nr:DUF2190 family protein [Candidatus Bathyarchaeota archaeon]
MAVLGGTNYKLRCSTNNDPWASLEFTSEEAYTAGQMIKLNDVVGVIINTILTAAIGVQAVLNYQAAKIIVPCVEITSGNLASMSVGKKVYFDATDEEVNPDSASNTLCGIVLVTPSVGDETIEIHLMGALGIVS